MNECTFNRRLTAAMTLPTLPPKSVANLESSEGRRFEWSRGAPLRSNTGNTGGKKGAATYSQQKRGREKTWHRKNSNVLPGKSLIPPQLNHMTFPKENATPLSAHRQARIACSDYLTFNYLTM